MSETSNKPKFIEAFGLKTRIWISHRLYGYGCAECCTGDRCEEDCTAVYKRKNCPHCKGKGWIKPEDVTDNKNDGNQ